MKSSLISFNRNEQAKKSLFFCGLCIVKCVIQSMICLWLLKMNTVDALVGTELIFENVLTVLTPEEIVSVLSSLVFQENSEVTPSLTERLEAVLFSQ